MAHWVLPLRRATLPQFSSWPSERARWRAWLQGQGPTRPASPRSLCQFFFTSTTIMVLLIYNGKVLVAQCSVRKGRSATVCQLPFYLRPRRHRFMYSDGVLFHLALKAVHLLPLESRKQERWTGSVHKEKECHRSKPVKEQVYGNHDKRGHISLLHRITSLQVLSAPLQDKEARSSCFSFLSTKSYVLIILLSSVLKQQSFSEVWILHYIIKTGKSWNPQVHSKIWGRDIQPPGQGCQTTGAVYSG